MHHKHLTRKQILDYASVTMSPSYALIHVFTSKTKSFYPYNVQPNGWLTEEEISTDLLVQNSSNGRRILAFNAI